MNCGGVAPFSLLAFPRAAPPGPGAPPFLSPSPPPRRWLGASNAVAAGLMLAASFGLIYEGVNHGLFRTLAGALLGLGFIVTARRVLRQDEHPAVFAGMGGLDARKALLIVGVMTGSGLDEVLGATRRIGIGGVIHTIYTMGTP